MRRVQGFEPVRKGLVQLGLTTGVVMAAFWAGWTVGRNTDAGNVLFPLTLLALGALVTRWPFWGLVMIAASVPIVDALPEVPYFTSITSLVGVLTFVSLLAQRLVRKARFSMFNRSTYALVALMVALVLLGQVRTAVSVERNYFLTYIQLFGLVWAAEQLLGDMKSIRILMIVYVLSVQISALFGIYELLLPSGGLGFEVGRLAGLVGNANGLGIHASIALVMSLYFYRDRPSKWLCLFSVLSVVTSSAALILSGSRGAVLFVAPVLGYQLLQEKGKSVYSIALALLVASLMVAIMPGDMLDRYANIPSSVFEGRDTVQTRIILWKTALQLWRESPVLGIGPGMFYYRTLLDPSLGDGRGLAAHNMYITFLAENGVIGILVFLAISANAVWNLIRAGSLVRHISPSLFSMIVAWQSVLLVLLLNGTKGNSGEHKIMWLSFGVAVALLSLATQSSSPTQKNKLSLRGWRGQHESKLLCQG